MADGNSKLVYGLLIGAAIPLLTAAIPWILEHATGDGRDLEFSVTESIEVNNAFALSVSVLNDGRSKENNVEVWVPYSSSGDIDVVLNRQLGSSNASNTAVLAIKTSVPAEARLDKNLKSVVITFDSLRPDERASISILGMSNSGYLYILDHSIERVVSADSQANKIDEREAVIIYKAGAFAALIIVVLAILAAIVGFLIPVETQVRWKQAELDALRKKLPPESPPTQPA